MCAAPCLTGKCMFSGELMLAYSMEGMLNRVCLSMMGVCGQVARILRGPGRPNKAKLQKNLCLLEKVGLCLQPWLADLTSTAAASWMRGAYMCLIMLWSESGA